MNIWFGGWTSICQLFWCSRARPPDTTFTSWYDLTLALVTLPWLGDDSPKTNSIQQLLSRNVTSMRSLWFPQISVFWGWRVGKYLHVPSIWDMHPGFADVGKEWKSYSCWLEPAYTISYESYVVIYKSQQTCISWGVVLAILHPPPKHVVLATIAGYTIKDINKQTKQLTD